VAIPLFAMAAGDGALAIDHPRKWTMSMQMILDV
jgi:hypothetical protein